MSIFLFNGFLLLSFIVVTVPAFGPASGPASESVFKSSFGSASELLLGPLDPALMHLRETKTKRCQYQKTYSLLEASCANLVLYNVPTYLKPDIQVLDATVNRIRELTNTSLSKFTELAYAYFGDNFIQTIEEGAFANQHNLEVLDLSQNGCDHLPKSLFQLPLLRTLYLGDNKLTDSVFKVEVTSPIITLQLTKNKLTKIPEIGFQSSLAHLNLSENAIVNVTTEDLAQFCSLKVLDLNNNPLKFNNLCECKTLHAWMKKRHIEVHPHPFDCHILTGKAREENCSLQFSNRTYELYEGCSNIIQQKVQTEKARSVWITVASCVSVFIGCVFVALLGIHRRNRRRRRKQKEQQKLSVNNANTELLNSNLTTANNS